MSSEDKLSAVARLQNQIWDFAQRVASPSASSEHNREMMLQANRALLDRCQELDVLLSDDGC